GGASEMNVFKEMGVIRQKNNVDNEIEILKKSLIVERVVRKLGVYASYTEIKPFKIIQLTGLDKFLPDFPKRKMRILYGDETPVLINIAENTLNNLGKNIVFDVWITPTGDYEFFGDYNDKKYRV